jgi:hypothetical protein
VREVEIAVVQGDAGRGPAADLLPDLELAVAVPVMQGDDAARGGGDTATPRLSVAT